MPADKLDALYEAYKTASTAQREAARDTLIKAMYQNGYAIVSAKLRSVQPYIVSDAVAQAVLYMDKFRGEAKFSSWFYGIVMNFCNRHIRENLEKREVSLDAVIEESGEEILGATRETNPLKIDLERVLAGLSEQERQLVELKMDGKTDKEIGKIIGLTKDGVHTRWDRLKKRLAARVQQGSADRT